MTQPELTETADRFVVTVADSTVTRCTVDYALTLVVGESEAHLYVTVEQPFWFRPSENEDEVRLAPEQEPEALGPVLSVLHRSIEEIVAHKDGLLEVRFAGGGALRAPATTDFEAWNVVGPHGLRLVAMPGGEVAVWKPQEG